MAKREPPPSKQINVRLGLPMVNRVDAWRERNPLRPTWTQIVEWAMAEWLERNDPSPQPKPPRR